ncbi:unnamed protein product [Cuscuta campestris]|uniref:Aminotransferase-like plant mobile domain-containing protein n=1 Tax=Cuscuta campestris TaxID=132261 RepID=A0A484NB50_9ASTE|nr:unnamed protein product [Cuscuta campestris]
MNAVVLIPVGDHSPKVDFRQHARALMFKIKGGALFASTTGNKVNLCLLELLVGTAQEVRSRAIGSATLACLYSNLCRAALSETTQIGGPLILLQIWAWERIPICRPHGVLPPEYGREHRGVLSSLDSVTVSFHLSVQGPVRQATWERAFAIWCACVSLIYTYMVEMYYPDRFCRQFDGLQDIPQAVDYDRELHAVRTTIGTMVPRTSHFVEEWEGRHQTSIDGFKYCFPVISVDGTHLHEGIDVAFNTIPQLLEYCVTTTYCLRHLRSNFHTNFNSKKLKGLMYHAASTLDVYEFNRTMQQIKSQWEEAYDWLLALPLEKWALCSDGGARYGILTTNLSESYNHVLKGCRSLLRTEGVAKGGYGLMLSLFRSVAVRPSALRPSLRRRPVSQQPQGAPPPSPTSSASLPRRAVGSAEPGQRLPLFL